ncbi:MAG TPA: DoxX family protein [Candidatus Angelobacter sp.]|nr:DoxX family protein [Candidatus Angelobacter sp.]
MIAKIQSLYERFLKIANSLQSPVLLLFRLDFGYQFFESGWAHLHTMPKFIEFLTSLGIPAPTLNAYFVAGLETVGGLLLALGLGSRLVSLLLAGDMVVAFITADSEALKSIFSSDPDKFFNAAPHTLLFVSLLILAFGPGKFALDTLIASWWKKRRPATV